MIYQQSQIVRKPSVALQLGDLELDRLDRLSEWDFNQVENIGLKLAYRVGEIDQFMDVVGPTDLHLFMYVPMSGNRLAREEWDNPSVLSHVRYLMKKRAFETEKKGLPKPIVVPFLPPEFMLEELDYQTRPKH